MGSVTEEQFQALIELVQAIVYKAVTDWEPIGADVRQRAHDLLVEGVPAMTGETVFVGKIQSSVEYVRLISPKAKEMIAELRMTDRRDRDLVPLLCDILDEMNEQKMVRP